MLKTIKIKLFFFVGFIEPHLKTVSVFRRAGAHTFLYLNDLQTLQRKREMLNKCMITQYTTQSIFNKLTVSINQHR